jgi:CRP-like cAMP-binding protein
LGHPRKQDWDLKKSVAIQTFAECQIFRNLSLGEIREISAYATPVRYGKGGFIFEMGDPAEYLYIVHEGCVKLHSISPSGKGLTFEISTSGDTLNGSALSTETYFMSAQALTDVTVLSIARN